MKEISFAGFVVTAPETWFDATAEVEGENPPATIAPEEGHGVLQFSLADFPAKGEAAEIVETFRGMLKEFAKAHDLGSPNNLATETAPRPLLAGNFNWDADFLRVWYTAAHSQLAFITYTCERRAPFAVELTDVEQIVRSLRFAERPEAQDIP